MATLSANIDATQTVIPVSGTAPTPGTFWTVGSESIQFLGTSRGQQGRAYQRAYWSVDRGIAGTTAATHLSGATLTEYHPDANGGAGGGVNVDNGVDAPAAVTTLVAPGAVIDGSSATLPVTFRLASVAVTYQTPGAEVYPGAPLFAVVAGEWIVDYWIQLQTQFNVTNTDWTYLQLGLATDGPVSSDGPSWNIGTANALETTTPTGDLELNAHGGLTDPFDHGAASIGNQGFARIVPARVRVDCNVTGFIGTDGTGGLSVGALTAFAIIATPAA